MDAPFEPCASFCRDRFYKNLLDSAYGANEDSCDSLTRAEGPGQSTRQRRSALRCASGKPGSGSIHYLSSCHSGSHGSVREESDLFGYPTRTESSEIERGLDVEDFASLRRRANFELFDVASQFSAPFGSIAKWESGEERPPVEVMRALRQIGDLRPSADILEFPALREAPGHDNTLFQGDCLEILPRLAPHSVDLVLCDLPYGTTQNRWDSVIDLKRLWNEYRRVLKANGVIVLTAQGVFTAKLILSNEGWFKYKIVWEKSKPTNFLNAKKQPLRKHEDVCVFYAKPPTYNPQMGRGQAYDKGVRKNQLSGSYGDFQPAHVRSDGGRYPSDIVYFKTAESERERTVWHPTQKPVELGRYLVRTYSNEGDIVLDNAFGSGSFLVAAAMEQRRFIGIERNEEVHLFKNQRIDYVALAAERLAGVGASTKVVR